MVPSLLWLVLKGSLFVVGTIVYWKRPQDESALRFYLLCVVTLGAYSGGYHWAHILTEPALMLVFIVCAILLPVTNLHFYLVFPRKNRWLEQYPIWMLIAIYGIPLCNLAGLIWFYVQWQYSQLLISITFTVTTLWYVACLAALVHSWWTLHDAMELKQVKCILFGIFLSMFPIAWSIYIVFAQREEFATGAVTWPMFVASLVVTVAFAVGMTRYRLMELNTIINSSMGYFLVSFLAGVMYYGVVFVGTLFYNRFVTAPTLPAALTVSTTALLFVVALDLARNRIKRALDRRFSKNKSQLDFTLHQMSQAFSQLVDPPVLAQRLLTTIADSLGVNRGAVYLYSDTGQSRQYYLAASRGDPPGVQEIAGDAPLPEGLKNGLKLQVATSFEGPGSQAQEQLRSLGADIAQPLMHDGSLLAFLLLGPKETPYRADDCTLLSAFAQFTVVALENAAKHRTIEQLHGELQDKVEKIAEQQRRILTLQTTFHRQSASRERQRAEPEKTEKVIHRITPSAEAKPTQDGTTATASATSKVSGIVGSSSAVHQLLNVVRKVAPTDAVVLLRGESGTGKELLARAVHETSTRTAKPYVKVHSAALAANLLESELFGHVKGAFTGAHRDKIGRFEMADGGTLFLDEIGDISLDVQTKLLRVLQERTFERVGSSETIQTDVRIIAATHRPLEELIRQGRFREDLFYRLNVFPIQVPPLRERVEDIPELVLHFVQQASQRNRKTLLHIEDDAMAALKSYAWPGNIRELENVIERAIVIAEGDTLTLHDLPTTVFQSELALSVLSNDVLAEREDEPTSVASSFRSERERFEREQLLRILTSANGNKAEAARLMGVARSTLVSRMKKLGLL
jgi:transcriptional regulator with GAF, ATPase, and Fis domain